MAWSEGFNWWRKGVNEEVAPGHHDSNLHDVNETLSGEKMDLASGEAIRNDGQAETADTRLHIIGGGKGSEDALGTLSDEDDEAAKFLRDPEGYRKAA